MVLRYHRYLQAGAISKHHDRAFLLSRTTCRHEQPRPSSHLFDRTYEAHFDRSNHRCLSVPSPLVRTHLSSSKQSMSACLLCCALDPNSLFAPASLPQRSWFLISRRRVASSSAICQDARYGGDRHKHRRGPLMLADLQDIAPSASADSCAGTCDLITSLTPHKRAQLKMTYQGPSQDPYTEAGAGDPDLQEAASRRIPPFVVR